MTARTLTLEPGETLQPRLIAREAPYGVLVVEGFVVREVITAGRVSADLIGPEDVIEPVGEIVEAGVLQHGVAWTALSATRLALLDDDLFARVAAWPELASALVQRAGRPGRRLVLSGAIATLPSIDVRLLASLWSWASQWGVVGADGVALRIPLSHERVGRLIGARRPTVTAVAGRLQRAGLLERRADRTWLLHAAPPDGSSDQDAGVAIPALESMIAPPGLGLGRPHVAVSSAARALAVREVRTRAGERRAALLAAAATREATLEKLRGEFELLREHRAAMSELRAQGATRREPPRPPPGSDGRAGPESRR